MNKKRIILLFLLAFVGLVIYKTMEMNHIFPKSVGVIIVNDTSMTTKPVQNADESVAILTQEPSITEVPQEPTVTEAPKGITEVSSNSDVVEVIDQEDKMFYSEVITQEIKDRIVGKSYGESCDLPYDDLRYVKVLYWGFDGEPHSGELIVNKAIEEDILEIFKELYDQQYPIEKMVLVDEYDADDNISMAADNTSAFNYRVVDGTDHLSLHSYGLAIDINPLYNPYVREMDGKTVILPVNGAEYSDRTLDCRYYIKKDDICYEAFISRGFTWGGDWKSQKDYQHFQKKID